MQFFIPFLAGIVLFYLFQYFPFTTISAASLSSLYLLAKKKALLILILLSGITFAFVRYEPLKEIFHHRDEVALRGVFESNPMRTNSGTFKQTFNIKSAVDRKAGLRVNELAGQEVTILSDREFDPGMECDITVKFLRSKTRFNPGEQTRDQLYANLTGVYDPGIKKTSLNSKIEGYRYRLNRYIDENFKKDSGDFVASITTGPGRNMSEELRDSFNVTGLAHILSISGTHFGLFSLFLFVIFRFVIKILPYRILQRITIFLTPSQAAALLCIPFMLAYLGISGGSVPAVRSFIMIGLFLLGLIIGRKGFWLNSLLFAAFILAVWEPEVIFSLSFQLSFLAVLFIGFSLGSREDKEKLERGFVEGSETSPRIRKVFRYIKNSVLLTLSATIGTAPLVAYYFHYFSVISPVSNFFLAPLIGFVLIPLSIVSSFLFLITGHYIFTPVVSVISDISISAVRLLSRIPFADIKVPAFPLIIVLLFYAGFIFYFLFNKRRSTLIIPFVPVMLYLLLSVFEKNELNITYIDVGQGDSSVIELPDGKTMVVDTGKTGRETSSFLKYRGKKTVDALILSHTHPDHTGGLDYILNRFKVKEIWDNGRLILPGIPDNTTHRALSRGDLIQGKGYVIHALHPYPDFYTMSGSEYVAANNDSLLLKFECAGKSFLFTGDVEEEAEENILHLGGWLKSDVIKVPHHGGKTSALRSFFDTVSPDVAVISAGRDNTFGHPHKEILDSLDRARIFRTDIDGAIQVSETAEGLGIKTYRGFQYEKVKSISDEIRNTKRLFQTW